jgi:uncharacterized OsmC-like protein
MGKQDLAEALQRAERVYQRRPGTGKHADAPATARWRGNTRVVASHANGTQIESDLPTEFGGTGDRVTPGWLFRAGVASCAAASIVMTAAAEGVDLAQLEVEVSSRSDSRGMLGMKESNGELVYPGPCDCELAVRIAAAGVAPERLRALVAEGLRRSPIPNALQNATPIALRVEVSAA